MCNEEYLPVQCGYRIRFIIISNNKILKFYSEPYNRLEIDVSKSLI